MSLSVLRPLALAALLAFSTAASPAFADAVDEEVARMTAEREFAAQWAQSAADALRARGDVESRALALLLAPPSVELRTAVDGEPVRAATDKGSAAEEAAIDEAALTMEAEVGFVLDAIEQLPVELRAAVVSEFVPRDDASRRLEIGERMSRAAPDDIAGLLIQLDALRPLHAEPARIDALLAAMAANLRGTRDLFFGVQRKLDAALAAVPPPAPAAPITWGDALGQSGKVLEGGVSLTERMDLDLLRLMHAMGRSMAIAQPGYQPLLQSCDESIIGAAPSRSSACETIGRQLALRGATLIDVAIGLVVWHRQVEGGPAEAEVVAAKRTHYWQQEQMTALLGDLSDTPEGLRRHAELIRASTSDELALFRDLMRERGIPLTPPREWMPANPAVLQARR